MKFAKFVGEPVDDRTLKMLQHTDLHAICKHKHIEATSDKEAIEKIKGSLWNELPKEVLAEICIVLGAKMNSWDTREDILQRICHIKTHNCDGQDCRHGSESGSSEGASPALEGEEANVLDEECDESSVGDAEYDEFYNEAVIDCLTAEETQNGLNVAWDEKLREEVIFPFVARHSGHEGSGCGRPSAVRDARHRDCNAGRGRWSKSKPGAGPLLGPAETGSGPGTGGIDASQGGEAKGETI
eukprot:tig00001027_g6393.t1